MFSIAQKREIAEKIQTILRETKHPELPEGEIPFMLAVVGKEEWSWAVIQNNSAVVNPIPNPFNEKVAEEMKKRILLIEFPIWSEGFQSTGEHGTATFHGLGIGRTFEEACVNFAASHPRFAEYFDAKRLTFWGCKLYSSEAAARKSFG